MEKNKIFTNFFFSPQGKNPLLLDIRGDVWRRARDQGQSRRRSLFPEGLRRHHLVRLRAPPRAEGDHGARGLAGKDPRAAVVLLGAAVLAPPGRRPGRGIGGRPGGGAEERPRASRSVEEEDPPLGAVQHDHPGGGEGQGGGAAAGDGQLEASCGVAALEAKK